MARFGWRKRTCLQLLQTLCRQPPGRATTSDPEGGAATPQTAGGLAHLARYQGAWLSPHARMARGGPSSHKGERGRPWSPKGGRSPGDRDISELSQPSQIICYTALAGPKPQSCLRQLLAKPPPHPGNRMVPESSLQGPCSLLPSARKELRRSTGPKAWGV